MVRLLCRCSELFSIYFLISCCAVAVAVAYEPSLRSDESSSRVTSPGTNRENKKKKNSKNHNNAKNKSRRSLIVGGETANPTDFPFFVKADDDEAEFGFGERFCGATLIHSDIILTAAHCQGSFNYGVNIYDPITKDYTNEVQIERQIRHPDFNLNNDSLNFDIMIIKLAQPILYIDPIPINKDPEIPFIGQALGAVGFGRTDPEGELSETLQMGTFRYIPPSKCAGFFPTINFDGANDVLCVVQWMGSSMCLGDSGGPLMMTRSMIGEDGEATTTTTTTTTTTLVGVTSFTVGCLPDNIPDGFARVSTFADWIEHNICELSENPPESCPVNDGNDPYVSGLALLKLYFTHDWCAHETTFAIRNKSTNAIEYAGPQYVPARGSVGVSRFRLPPGEYVMEVYDKGADGLMSPSYVMTPHGSWELYISFDNDDDDDDDDENDRSGEEMIVASGGAEFESTQLTDFVVMESPTTSPSMTPIPSTSPSRLPTLSMIPSELPSTNPTITPSDVPTTTTPSNSSAAYSLPIDFFLLAMGGTIAMVF